MDQESIRKLLNEVRKGHLGVEAALERLRAATLDELGFATLDLQRTMRRGFPEVIYGASKSTEQIVEIVRRMGLAGQTVFVTRVGREVHEAVLEVSPKAVYHAEARAIVVRRGRRRRGRPGILVVTAGTSDLPVAEEAALAADLLGNDVHRIHDVGVAGIHRLLEHRDALLGARVIVAVAGMEGALPSVLAGLTDCPVIGVPTSVGYGAGAGGQAALLTMLNSCAPGLTVVNIDNGYGAGVAAGLINRAGRKRGAPNR